MLMSSMEDALQETFDETPGTKKDKAIRELALLYAQALDEQKLPLEVGGPRLLQALDHLLLTPKSRRMTAKTRTDGDANKPGTNPLDELKRKRAARIDDAEDLHSASS
jgi:hypothetical protein